MRKQFEGITRIDDRELYDLVIAYSEMLLREATVNGWLDCPNADNEYTRELGRTIGLCADYERDYMVFDNIDFNAPLGYYDDEDPDLVSSLSTLSASAERI
jgi:hypothetical protein